MKPPAHPADQKNLFIAMALAIALMMLWQVFIEIPKRQQIQQWQAVEAQKKQVATEKARAEQLRLHPETAPAKPLTRAERLSAAPRITIRSNTLDGSLSLKGLRIDDLSLRKYRTELDPNSPEVNLLSPQGDEKAYFMQAGWLNAAGGSVRLPDETTLWRADKKELSPGSPVILSWDNGEGLKFTAIVSLDEHYMFTVTQRVENASGREVKLVPYGFVHRSYHEPNEHYLILHEGPLGVLDGTLSEGSYKELREKGKQVNEGASGWLGFTDKYWLAAVVPGAEKFTGSFEHYQVKDDDRYQAEYMQSALAIPSGDSADTSLRFFAGAKEVGLLDAYAKGANDAKPIPLFDRAIDFGVLYFLTKPMMVYILNPFFHLTGNFGIAILLLTIVVKLLMFPLANKGYLATSQLRELQPEMLKLRDKHKDDKLKQQQAMMALYKEEKVNPAAGCLPMLIQIPVFFALYKVLFVTIEMRHAPFFAWIHDLSAPDPTNIFTAFGLIPWEPWSWMHLGVLPIAMGVTMKLQMMMQPKPNDPVQAKVMGLMPIFLTFVLAKMPAGLVLYWTWSNVLSILQQYVITKRHAKRKGSKAKVAAAEA